MQFLAPVLLLVTTALPSATLAAGADGPTLTGSVVDDDGEPVSARVEVFFDVDGSREPVTEEVRSDDDGSFRVVAPKGARQGHPRARIGSRIVHGPPVWLVRTRPDATVEVPPLVDAERVPVDARATGDAKSLPRATVIAYFPEDAFPGEQIPLSAGRIACATVGGVDERGRITVDSLPRAGGYLVLEAEGFARNCVPVEFDSGRGEMFAEFELIEARPLKGDAPSGKLFDRSDPPEEVLIAPFLDPVASNGPGRHAVMYYRGRSHLPLTAVACDSAFELSSHFGYAPVLGAWGPDDDGSGPPSLIAAYDAAVDGYTSWNAPVAAEIEVDGIPEKLERLLKEAKLGGNLWMRTSGGHFGDGIDVEWTKDGLVVRSENACPAGDTFPELLLRADGATLFQGEVPVGPRSTYLGLVDVGPFTVVEIEAVDGDGEPVADLEIAAFDEDDEDAFGPLLRLVTDSRGRASALFDDGAFIGFEPDRARGTTVGGPRLLERLGGGSQELRIEVVAAFGAVEVRLAEIDDGPARVALLPEGQIDLGQYRTSAGRSPDGAASWAVDTVGSEIAAAVIRSGGVHRFDDVPAGAYIVAVEAGVDPSEPYFYMDLHAAANGRLARRVDVVKGETTSVVVEPPAAIRVHLEPTLPKDLSKSLTKRLRAQDAPPVVAREIHRYEDAWTVSESAEPIELGWNEDGHLTGELVEGVRYVLHVGAIGPVDTAHVIVAGEDAAESLRFDGEIALDLGSRARGEFEVRILAVPRDPKGEPVYRLSLPAATYELRPRRGELLLTGLSPHAEHRITVTQDGKSAEVAVDPLVSDRLAQVHKRTKRIRREITVRLR